MQHTTRRAQGAGDHNIWSASAEGASVAAIAAAAVLLISGCAQPAVTNRGPTNQVPTDVRGPYPSDTLGSKELQNTTDVMLASIVDRLGDLRRDEDGRTVVVMDRIVNRSNEPTEDFEIFLAQLRSKLNQSGARYQIMFVEQPGRADAVRGRVLEEGLKDDYDIPGARPHYALTGSVYTLPEDAGKYWLMQLQLTDLDPNSRYRNGIAWEDAVGYRFAR